MDTAHARQQALQRLDAPLPSHGLQLPLSLHRRQGGNSVPEPLQGSPNSSAPFNPRCGMLWEICYQLKVKS